MASNFAVNTKSAITLRISIAVKLLSSSNAMARFMTQTNSGATIKFVKLG